MDNTEHWYDDAVFYHIYPLGYCDAPQRNDFSSAPVNRLQAIVDELPGIADLGCNALYLSPVFESVSHGYDTVDYGTVDRRLGTNDDLRSLVDRAHEAGMRVILDGVFNHVGREFVPFRDLRARGSSSPYTAWFRGVDFSGDNRFGDGFYYDGWEGTDDLVTLELTFPPVREFILDAAANMVVAFGIDGLRLDVAYLLPLDFLRDLRTRTDAVRPDFWLLGEVIHGDYASFVAPGHLHAVTNYECYKGLWSSFNDKNMHEIAWSLNRLLGDGGLLAGSERPEGAAPAYNFADNHDVDRVASSLSDPGHLFPLYGLLFTIPGVPSVYYGSEWGIRGEKRSGDSALRPAWNDVCRTDSAVMSYISELARIRRDSYALRRGVYRQIAVAPEQLAFSRTVSGETVLVAVNASSEPVTLPLDESVGERARCLFSGKEVTLVGNAIEVPAHGTRVVRVE